MVEIKGDWIGYYTYDKGYPEVDRKKKIPFRLTIERGINGFVGQLFEEADYGGIEDRIMVKGIQSGDEIEFTKYYALEHFLDENDEIVSVESENPTTVYYKGKFDPTNMRFNGEWEITGLKEDEDGVFHEDNQTGRWFIWREG